MKRSCIENVFLSEKLMLAASTVAVICGLASMGLMTVCHEVMLLDIFEKTVKIIATILLYWAFAKYHWDVVRGLMGGVLFCLMYQESFLVLGDLWRETADFDAYLIMGVEGSLYLAAQSMSFMMTIIITINHFIITYNRTGNTANLIFNQITICFKILLYISLIIINAFIDLPVPKLVNAGLEYIADLALILILICVEAQLDNFKVLREELLNEKRGRRAKA